MPWPPPECQAAGGEVGTGMLSFAVADVTVWERKRQNSLLQLLAFVPLTLSFTSSQDPTVRPKGPQGGPSQEGRLHYEMS